MSELLPFCKVKLQYFAEMVTDHELDDNALRVALYLAQILKLREEIKKQTFRKRRLQSQTAAV